MSVLQRVEAPSPQQVAATVASARSAHRRRLNTQSGRRTRRAVWGCGIQSPGPVSHSRAGTIVGVRPIITASVEWGAELHVGPRTYQGVDERSERPTRQIGFGTLDAFVKRTRQHQRVVPVIAWCSFEGLW
jgi:hypothetical protein